MRLRTVLAALALALAGFSAPALAVNPEEMLKDPVLEQRARDISKGLRCVVCQNQSIDDSDAELARDLRIIVRQRLSAGDSDSAVVQFVVDRYGDYVLLKPPFKASTFVLWVGPFILLLLALVAVYLFYRRRPAAVEPAPAKLSAEEERKLKKLLGDAP
jgi:cytochrome c-type biogenesis protein CcmH